MNFESVDNFFKQREESISKIVKSEKTWVRKIVQSKDSDKSNIFYSWTLENNQKEELDHEGVIKIYKIPVKFLTLNPENSRIEIQTQENGEKFYLYGEKGQKEIQNWIWEDRKLKNETTKSDLQINGQIEAGMITSDGVVISGNRRVSILNKLEEEGEGEQYFFTAVINYLSWKNNEEIKRYELKTQFGNDRPLDYLRLNTMLAIRNYKNLTHKTNDEVLKHFNWKEPGGMQEILNILNLMDEYLGIMNWNGTYSYVLKLEDQFRSLGKAYRELKNNKVPNIKWKITEIDEKDFKYTMFKVLRFQPEGKKFRKLVNLKKSEGHILSHKNTWESLVQQMNEEEIRAEKAKKKIQENRPMTEPRKIEFAMIESRKEHISKIIDDYNAQVNEIAVLNTGDKLILKLEESVNKIENFVEDDSELIKNNFLKKIKQTKEKIDDVIEKIVLKQNK